MFYPFYPIPEKASAFVALLKKMRPFFYGQNLRYCICCPEQAFYKRFKKTKNTSLYHYRFKFALADVKAGYYFLKKKKKKKIKIKKKFFFFFYFFFLKKEKNSFSFFYFFFFFVRPTLHRQFSCDVIFLQPMSGNIFPMTPKAYEWICTDIKTRRMGDFSNPFKTFAEQTPYEE